MKRDVTIVFELECEGVQAWTFSIDDKDLSRLAKKYGDQGESVLADAETIGEEIKKIWK